MMALWRLLGRCGYYAVHPLVALILRDTNRTRIIVRHQDKVLVVLPWLNNGRWDLPGGGLHRNEDSVQGALRELQEEIGLTVEAQHARQYTVEQFKAGLIKYTAHYIIVTLPYEVRTFTLQKHEIVAARWAQDSELVDLPMISPALQKHARAALRLGA